MMATEMQFLRAYITVKMYLTITIHYGSRFIYWYLVTLGLLSSLYQNLFHYKHENQVQQFNLPFSLSAHFNIMGLGATQLLYWSKTHQQVALTAARGEELIRSYRKGQKRTQQCNTWRSSSSPPA